MNRFKKIFLLLLILNLAFWSLIKAENSLILEIELIGNYNIDEQLIKSLFIFEVGQNLKVEDVSKTINNLYQLGVFEDVLIEKQDFQQGILIAVHVKEFPIVNSVTFKGNKKIKSDNIQTNVNLKKGSYWSPFLQREVINNISEEYKKKGYHLAFAEFEITELGDNKVDILVNISEGSKVTIKKIKIFGNKDIPSKKILGIMKTKKASLLRSGKFEKEKFDEDLNSIIAYYNKKGYIDARILSFDKKLIEGKFIIEIYLYEGNTYKFGQVLVSGNERFTDELIVSNFKFKEDETFNLQKFNKQLGKVASMYYEEGYIYSNFEHELEKDEEKINIKLNIQENTRAKVHKIHIKGNRKTKEKVIRRHLAIAPGDYFRQSKVMRTQNNIYNMGFFEPDLYPDYQPINSNGDIDLIIHVNDKPSGSANGGIAINSQDGIVGQISVSNNNLFGNSWAAGLKWEFGGKTQNYEISFTNPYFMDSSTLVGFNFYHTSKEWSTYEIKTNGGTIRLGRPLGFLNFAKIICGYSFYQKKYRILGSIDPEDVSETLAELDKEGWKNTSSLSMTISRDNRDNIFFPTTGTQFTLYSELAGGPLQGDFNYFKQIAQVSWFTKTIWQFVLSTKWRFGYVTGYKSDEVPPDERFYLGGTGPDGIRGYADRSVGPNEGGLREIIFSTEYSWPIAGDQLIGLLFFDAGDSYNSLKDFNFWNMKKGSGIGIRVRSPFGLIGFDYAHNFEIRRWEPHFQFGTTF